MKKTGIVEKTGKWLRKRFPGMYKRFGRYFHTHYRLQRRILRHARRHPELYADPDLAAAVKRLRQGGISVFSFSGHEKYGTLEVEVHLDEDGFPWVAHGGRRLYFRRGTPQAWVVGTYRRLLAEQDPASPHCYRAEGFGVRPGDMLLDVGAAEGIFALDNVERVSRVILFEVEEQWIGALMRTFEPWKDKVTIINRFASDTDDSTSVRIDTMLGSKADGEIGGEAGATTVDHTVDLAADQAARHLRPMPPIFLKLDVEGAEERVLRGAEQVLARDGTRAVVCTYHRGGDHKRLSEAMRARGFEVATSPGRMLFMHDRELAPPFFRHGVIYCWK